MKFPTELRDLEDPGRRVGDVVEHLLDLSEQPLLVVTVRCRTPARVGVVPLTPIALATTIVPTMGSDERIRHAAAASPLRRGGASSDRCDRPRPR